MADDYAYPEKRKTRRDDKAKRRFRVYKKGGKYRGSDMDKADGKNENAR